MILVDEHFHEKEVDFKFLPGIGSIIEVELDKLGKNRARFTIIGNSSRDMVPVLHLKGIDEE